MNSPPRLGTDRTALVAIGRAAVVVVAAWVAFAVVQASLMHWVRPAAGGWIAAFTFYATLALFWSAVTPVVVWWHRRLSARTSSITARIVAHLPLAAAVAVLDAVVLRTVVRAMGSPAVVPFPATLIYYADMVAVSYVAIVLAAEALAAHAALTRRTRHTARLETQLARARLEYLDAQLQPHFLFNSLGAVSELAYESPAAATRMLDQITSLFRFALATETNEITLGEELVALEPYLDIQRVRFADWLTIDQDIDDRATRCLVPRLVLQPLVENAVRHGLAGRTSAGSIEIHARVAGDRLVVRVRDNGVGLRETGGGDGRGIGLANLRERLEAFYGGGEHLRLARDEPGTVAELEIPARYASARASDAGDTADASDDADADIAPAARVNARYSLIAILVTWLACGALWTQQSLLYLRIRERPIDSLLSIVRSDMTSAAMWAVLTVVVLAVTARFPLVWRRLMFYVIGSVAIAAAHVLSMRAIYHPEIPLASQTYTFAFALNLLIAWTLIAVGHRRRFLQWLRERELAAARLASAVASARSRALAVRADPGVLVTTLERLIDLVPTNPAATERVLMRLGDYLRASLDANRATDAPDTRAAALELLRLELDDAGVSTAYAERRRA